MARKVITIARRPHVCWRGFTDPESFCAWVPNLRAATVMSKHDDGLPKEVMFELASGRRYTLEYSYSSTDVARIVRWMPRVGANDAVRGFARFEPVEGGTQITYELEHGPSRTELEKAISGVDEVLDAFSWWILDQSERHSP